MGDQNADGCISRDEMRFAFSNYDILALYDAFGITKGQKESKSDTVYTNAIDKLRSDANIDPDASGEIDLNELKDHYNRETNDVDNNDDEIVSSAKSILSALDVNSDGKISREEMRAGFNQFNPKSLSKALGAS